MVSINAVTLVTADMAASVAFYTALGFGVSAGGADAAFTTYELAGGFPKGDLEVYAPAQEFFYGNPSPAGIPIAPPNSPSPPAAPSRASRLSWSATIPN